jgi:signal transduction histidine kinase
MATQIEAPPRLRLETIERPFEVPEAVDWSGHSAHAILAEFAHDLCTPVYSIGTTVELLLDTFESLDKLDKDEAARLLRRVRQGTRWLQVLLGDLTHGRLAPAPGDRLNGKPLSIGRCLERSLEIVQPLLDLRSQQIDLRLPPRPIMVWGDEHQLRRVVLNLMSNAAKYSLEHDVIEVEVITQPEWALVEVRDHGPGVRPLDQMRIFNRHVRGPAAGNEAPPNGSGLGLSIVKSLVELHAGKVGVRSEAGKGATFWFRLPRLGSRRRVRRCVSP